MVQPLEAAPQPPRSAARPPAVRPPLMRSRRLSARRDPMPRKSRRSPMTSEKVPHLFDRWEQVAERLRAANRIELFTDFDGTLVEFRFGTDQVSLGKRSRAALARLARNPSIHVAIVSGRRSSALRRFIKVPNLRFMGLYGWEDGAAESGKKKGHRFPPRALAKLAALRRELKTLPAEIPGIRLEDKGLSLAIHFRGASATSRKRAEARMRAIRRQGGGDLQVLGANCVWDIVPRQVRGKGAAIREVLAGVPAKTLPIFLGDDLTDEPAFAALRGGITVLVGPARPTLARYGLRNPGEVRLFLERLEEALHEKS